MNRDENFFNRHREFLLSRQTMLTLTNGLLLLVGFIVSLIAGIGFIESATVGSTTGKWIYFAAALAGGVPIVIRAFKAVILRRDITVDLMVAVAMIAAIIVGEYVAAAIVVFMLSIGETLEDYTVSRAENALKELEALLPATVTVRRDGREVVVPIEQIVSNDIVLVRSGERIGVDGTITTGSATVNQAPITGESMPVEKQEADKVFAGTFNELGTLEIRVTSVGDATTMAQIIKLVKEAQESQAPIQRLANRYATFLVPITFLIAIGVGLLTQDVMRFVTVLVVVCPCALVLATPTAVVAAIGNAAKRGILVKSGRSIEQVGKVDVVAFDKTGTLTVGKPMVREVITFGQLEVDYLTRLAATIERFSEHPIGRTIVEAAQKKGITLGEPVGFTVLPGFGVQGRINEQNVTMGNDRLLREQGISLSPGDEARVTELEKAGNTVVLVAVNNVVEGAITLADEPRPEAKQAISELKKLGVEKVIMLTGDSSGTAWMISSELGVDHFHAEVLPAEKLGIIRELQKQGKKVAFVGDGINDAPSIAAADIGIAMGLMGTDTAFETADVCLMKDDITRIPYIIGLSRKSLKIIWLNVLFSMSVNIGAVVLGGLGIIGPVVGAILHETSALPVLANSARLINYGKGGAKKDIRDSMAVMLKNSKQSAQGTCPTCGAKPLSISDS